MTNVVLTDHPGASLERRVFYRRPRRPRRRRRDLARRHAGRGSGPSAVFIVWIAPNCQLKPGINRNPDPPRGCPRVKMLDASTRGKRLA